MADNLLHRRKPRNNSPETDPNSKKKNTFPTSAAFRGLGCKASASSQVSVPAVIRTSANWEPKKLKKERPNAKNKLPIDINTTATNNHPAASQSSLSLAFTSSSDVWCAPILSDAPGPVEDCVVSTRPTRPKHDRIVLAQRERSYSVRRMVIPEDNPFIESEAGLAITRIRSDVSGSRHHRHVRHGFHEGLAEIVMLQSRLLMGGRSNGLDRYRDLRLDVDDMSYEELLELGDRIGYVNTGLREDEITRCLRRTKLATLEDLLLHCASEMERKCSICQEEYEGDDETGMLNCRHFYHMHCIKQWLGQKNVCPICKTAALSQTYAE